MVRLGSPVQVRSEAVFFSIFMMSADVQSAFYLAGEEIMAKAKKGAVELIALQCTTCKRKNYTTTKNRRNVQGKLELKKYCKWCKGSTDHKETKIK